MEFQNGDIDLMMSTPRNNLPQLSADSNYKVEAFDTVTVNYIGFNVEAEAVSSKEVRQALAYATNVDDLIVGANQGYAQRVTTFTDNLDVLRNTGLEGYTHDVEKAKSLLADAGYADGLTLTLSITSGNTTEAQIAAILKEQWAPGGRDAGGHPIRRGHAYRHEEKRRVSGGPDQSGSHGPGQRLGIVFHCVQPNHQRYVYRLAE